MRSREQSAVYASSLLKLHKDLDVQRQELMAHLLDLVDIVNQTELEGPLREAYAKLAAQAREQAQ